MDSISSKSSFNFSSSSSCSEEDFENLSTNFVSSNDTQSLKEELKFYNEKIVGLENQVKENNALLLQIDAKLDKFLNLNIFKEEKKNILHKMSPAPQINNNLPIFNSAQNSFANNWLILPEKFVSSANTFPLKDEAEISKSEADLLKEENTKNISNEEKENINIVHEMVPAPQIEDYNKNFPAIKLKWPEPGSNFFLLGKQIFDYSILQLDNYPFIKIINLKNNKWANILLDWGCCRNNCVNISQRGFCQKGNGIVRLRDNIAKYYLSTVKNGINRSFKIISEKGFTPSKENNILYYFEVKIIPEIEEECGWAVEIGLFKDNSQQFRVCSNGLFCSKTSLNSPYKQIPMFGCLIKPMDIIGCGIYFPQLNNENNSAQLFFTLNGKKKGKTIFVELNDDKDSLLFYPNVSLFCCSVEANFGTNKFLYKIGEFKE
uniref:Uncharacterized protein n=2 Tax=Meloidogyne enterolobii TaxID=390850 RepID=A0A6V7XJR6_MELEN|nr:unnamed protein product [Meloidogyne enterolobii]